LHNFIKRTDKRVAIIKSQLYACKAGLELANKLKENI